MTQPTFDFFTDPGHGWLKVTQKHLNLIGLKPADFTSYSYVKGDALYLEEDQDASLFINKWKEHFGEGSFKIRENHTNNQSRIRSYDCNG